MKQTNKINSFCDIAVKYGIDLSLLDINLKKTPAKRILDMNVILNGITKIREAMKNNVN